MTTASLERAAGSPARDLAGGIALRVAALIALLSLAPPVARVALAQRSAGIVATATVVSSLMNAGLEAPPAAGARPAPPSSPMLRRVCVAGVGIVSIRTGPDQPIRVAPGVPDPRESGAPVLQISYVGS